MRSSLSCFNSTIIAGIFWAKGINVTAAKTFESNKIILIQALHIVVLSDIGTEPKYIQLAAVFFFVTFLEFLCDFYEFIF